VEKIEANVNSRKHNSTHQFEFCGAAVILVEIFVIACN